MGTKKSQIDIFVNSLDLAECTQRLLDRARYARDELNYTTAEIAKCCGMPYRRMRYILNEAKNPKLYQEEVEVIRTGTGTGLDVVFDLPDLSDKDSVWREFRQRQNDSGIKAFVGPVRSEEGDVDIVRGALYIPCLETCLGRYERRHVA